jgi:hypothetical protein
VSREKATPKWSVARPPAIVHASENPIDFAV